MLGFSCCYFVIGYRKKLQKLIAGNCYACPLLLCICMFLKMVIRVEMSHYFMDIFHEVS